MLLHVLDTCLRLLHPYMPFVTEEIWQYLPHEGETLMLASWPEADPTYADPAAEDALNALMEMVRGIRNVRLEYNVDPGRRIQARMVPGSFAEVIDDYSYIFGRLCNVSEITLQDAVGTAEDSAAIVVQDATIYLPLAGMIDVETERQRLAQDREKVQQGIRALAENAR